ncbi:MAG: hypothetical protein JWR42_1070 [Marmoricola sp.]|nr:hypothetical protein [Marmoricola sp.]
MALVDAAAGLVFTAAPGTASTALGEALLAQRPVEQVPAPGETRRDGVDVKHGTVAQLVAAGLLPADHGLQVVTTTRNPFDFYVAEHERTRTRWVHELRDPDSWVHRTPGAVDRIVDAVTLDFDAWLVVAIGDPAQPRRVNRGHVEEADVVLRMEHLEGDLLDLVGLQLRVPATNVTERGRAYWRSYSVHGRRLVEQAHAADLARFGYVL